MTRFGWLLTLGLLLIIGGAGFLVWHLTQPKEIACTMEAKICPDGSSVGRVGPSCEFAACPTPQVQTVVDEATGSSFSYLPLTTTYISGATWPPTVTVTDTPFSCEEASSRLIDGRTYCVTEEGEGAAGSIYTTYAYAFADQEQTVTLTFTLRATQCANYDEPQATSCTEERDAFSTDDLIARIAPTFTHVK